VTGALFGLAWFATIEAGALTEALDLRLARFAVYAAFCFVMVVITFIDLDHKLILDKITLPSIVIFYGLGLLLGRTWHHGLIGAIIGYGLPWSIGEIYWLLTDREGLGLGDSKLLAVIGALLGVTGVVASLFGGAVTGAVIGVIVLLRAKAAEPATDEGSTSSPLGVVASLAAVVSVVIASIAGSSDATGSRCRPPCFRSSHWSSRAGSRRRLDRRRGRGSAEVAGDAHGRSPGASC